MKSKVDRAMELVEKIQACHGLVRRAAHDQARLSQSGTTTWNRLVEREEKNLEKIDTLKQQLVTLLETMR